MSGGIEMVDKHGRPIGTWFYIPAGFGTSCELWQECEDGPHYAGWVTNHPTAEFICEKLNEPPLHLVRTG